MLSVIIFVSQSYLILSVMLLFGYVLVIDECYIKKWEDAFSKITISDTPMQKCTIQEVEPVYTVPRVDASVGEAHREAFIGREYYRTN